MAFNSLREEHFKVLWSLWNHGSDRRRPSPTSVRAWCESEGNLDPRRVSAWFSKRRTNARAEGLNLSEETFDLVAELSKIQMAIRKNAEESVQPGSMSSNNTNSFRNIAEGEAEEQLFSKDAPQDAAALLVRGESGDEDHRSSSTLRSSHVTEYGTTDVHCSSTPPSSPSTPVSALYLEPRFVSSATTNKRKASVTPATSIASFNPRHELWSPLPPSSPFSSSPSIIPQSEHDLSSPVPAMTLPILPRLALLPRTPSPLEPPAKRRKIPAYLHESSVTRDFSMELDPLCAGECMTDCESLCRETLWAKAEEKCEGFFAPRANYSEYLTSPTLEPVTPIRLASNTDDLGDPFVFKQTNSFSSPFHFDESLLNNLPDYPLLCPKLLPPQPPAPICSTNIHIPVDRVSTRLPRYLQLYDSLFCYTDGSYHAEVDEVEPDADDVLKYELGQPLEAIMEFQQSGGGRLAMWLH